MTEMQRSSREPAALRDRLRSWLGRRLPAGSAPEVGPVGTTSATGLSSDTLLFDAAWTEAGARRTERLVARLAPDPADVPVFPTYDLGKQFDLIRAVGARTDVPVPPTFWCEPDPVALGAPFFVMGRVDGLVPPDLMPYTFGDNWLFDATPAQRRDLQDATVDVLARLHALEPWAALDFAAAGATALARHVAHTRAWYEFVAADGARSRLVERAFRCLAEHWPAHESAPVVSWGDARVGNVMYQDFRPVAVLDWEMAGVGPRELDIGFCVYAHRGFEDLAHTFDLPGLPDFLRRDDVVGRYTAASGYEPRDLDFYEAYAALQFAVVYLRTGCRAVHFGEREMPGDPDELIYNREPLERMLAGAYFGGGG